MAKNPFDKDGPDPFEKARGRFGRPTSSFEKLQPYEGRLLLITPTAFTSGIVTKFTKPGEDGSDAVTADVVVLDGDEAPKELPAMMLFQKFIVGQLKGSIGGKPVLGVLGKQPSQKGNDAWVLLDDDVTDEQVDLAIAYMDAKEAEAKKERVTRAGAAK